MTTFENLRRRLVGKRLLIFDFDGTIADTSLLHASAFQEILEPLGVAVDYPSIAGLKTRDAMVKCLGNANKAISDAELVNLVLAKQLRVRKLLAMSVSALPGVDEFLRWARSRYQISMATSGSRETVEIALLKLGYREWFNPLVCADDVQDGKPDPAVFFRVLELTSVPASEALVFEDSPIGMLAAGRAGIEYLDVTIAPFSDVNPSLLD